MRHRHGSWFTFSMVTLFAILSIANTASAQSTPPPSSGDIDSLIDLFGEDGYDDLSHIFDYLDEEQDAAKKATSPPKKTPPQRSVRTISPSPLPKQPDRATLRKAPVPNRNPARIEPTQSPRPQSPPLKDTQRDTMTNPFVDESPTGDSATNSGPPAAPFPSEQGSATKKMEVPSLDLFDSQSLDETLSDSSDSLLMAPTETNPFIDEAAPPFANPPAETPAAAPVIDAELESDLDIVFDSPDLTDTLFSDEAKALTTDSVPESAMGSGVPTLAPSDAPITVMPETPFDRGAPTPSLSEMSLTPDSLRADDMPVELEPISREDDLLPDYEPAVEDDPFVSIESLPLADGTPDGFDLPVREPFSFHQDAADNQYPNARLTGFFHADYSWFDQDFDFFTVDAEDSRGFRRARLAAIGSVADNVDYMLEMDFGFAGRPTFMDLYMDIHGTRWGSVRIGQWRQPFGLGELNSVRDLTFHERAQTFFLAPFRQTGVGIYGQDGRSTYAISAFGTSTNTFGTSNGDESYGGAGRLTTLLRDNRATGSLLHIGAGYTHIQNTQVGFSQRGFNIVIPSELIGATLNSPLAVPTTVSNIGAFIPSSQSDTFNAEVAMIRGAAHAQAELRMARYDRAGVDDVTIPAVYAQFGYLLTGESRMYDRKSGTMSGIQPNCNFGKGGMGAWELAARYSHIDLNHGGLFGGRNNSLTFGVNWYLNRYTKFQFNYLRSIVSRPNRPDDRVGTYALRAQVQF